MADRSGTAIMDSVVNFLDRLRQSAIAEQSVLEEVGGVIILLVVCWLSLVGARRWIVLGIERVVGRTETDWDDALQRSGLFDRLAPLLPALIAWYGVALLPLPHENIGIVVRRVASALMILVTVRCIAAFLNATNDIYSRNPEHRDRPIKGYLQVVTIIIHLIGVILVLSVLMDKSPWLFLSGIGALTAVLLLVFRDTLLSLVASILLTSNNMLHVGDWIEMPQYGADGNVIDIALHTVKVQNFDKTITTIPTYQLINSSFRNWRGMSRAGGRRIMRSIYIDIGTIRFLDAEQVEKFSRVRLLSEYIRKKQEELVAYNTRDGVDREMRANLRTLTNIGTFRAYAGRYLANHPDIHKRMTLLVRQLAPTSQGLPIEIYCFTMTTDWNEYEAIQADIFDHLLSVLPEFGLRAFQNPAGRDIADLASAG